MLIIIISVIIIIEVNVYQRLKLINLLR